VDVIRSGGEADLDRLSSSDEARKNWENGVDMESFESLLTNLDDSDPLSDRRAVVGNLGTLSERMGLEEAEQFVRENSLTTYTRIRAAQRLGGISTSRL